MLSFISLQEMSHQRNYPKAHLKHIITTGDSPRASLLGITCGVRLPKWAKEALKTLPKAWNNDFHFRQLYLCDFRQWRQPQQSYRLDWTPVSHDPKIRLACWGEGRAPINYINYTRWGVIFGFMCFDVGQANYCFLRNWSVALKKMIKDI